MIAACVAGSGAVGGGNIAPETIFRLEGSARTPFTALVTDSVASWKIDGSVPLNVVVLNNSPPTRMYASKLSDDSSLLSVAIISGGTLLHLASTQQPLGTVVIQTSIGLQQIAPAANPDTRFFVKGAPGAFFNGLIEDRGKGFSLGNTARTLFLFENPSGKVDGLFNLPGFPAPGLLDVDLLIGGAVVANAVGQPTVQLVAP